MTPSRLQVAGAKVFLYILHTRILFLAQGPTSTAVDSSILKLILNHNHQQSTILKPNPALLFTDGHTHVKFLAMSDQVQELLNVPREFLKDGMQFINRSQKRGFFCLR